MPGYAMVTYAYATPKQYLDACVAEAMRWAGNVVQDGIEGWVAVAQVMLTAENGRVYRSEDNSEVTATNGRGVAAVLQVQEVGAVQ